MNWKIALRLNILMSKAQAYNLTLLSVVQLLTQWLRVELMSHYSSLTYIISPNKK